MKKIVFIMFTAVLGTAFSCKRGESLAPTPPTANSTSLAAAMPAVALVAVLVAGSANRAGYVNATGLSARFNQPSGIIVNPDGTLLIADQRNGAARKITNSAVTTIVKSVNLVGIYNLASTNDGTIAFNSGGGIILYKSGALHYVDQPIDCAHCSMDGLSKSADGTFFLYGDDYSDGASSISLGALKPNGTFKASPGGYIEFDDEEFITAISTTLSDNKFITLYRSVYEFTHSGAVSNILPNTTFDGLTGIAVNKDGTKLYLADNGDIKLITRCTSCPSLLTVLIAHVAATGLALSNSEKVLYFTSSTHHTVNKINLP